MAFKTTGDLEQDIRQALIVNIGKDYYDAGNKGQKSKIDDLAEALKGSIVEWIKRQSFQITEMQAPVLAPPPGKGLAVLTKSGKNTIGDPLAQANWSTSEVKLLRDTDE